MPNPTVSSVHVDQILTNISVAFEQSPNNFIAGEVFPTVPVAKQTDKYYKYNQEDWFRDEAQIRADATESAGSGYDLSTDSYSCDVYALHKDIGDQLVANADSPLNPKSDAARWLMQRFLIRREKQFVADAFATSVWATDRTGVASGPTSSQFIKWSDYVSSDPGEDFEQGKEDILSVTGLEANTLVLGYQTYRQLKRHPVFVDQIKYTTPDNIGVQLMASLLEIPKVLIAKSISNTAAEGVTASYSFTHGKGALLLHVADTPSLLTPSAGYTFSWQGVSNGLGEDVGIKDFRMEELAADRIEGQVAFDNKIVATNLGVFYDAAVA